MEEVWRRSERLRDGFAAPGGQLRIRRLWRSFRRAHDFLKIFWFTDIDYLTLLSWLGGGCFHCPLLFFLSYSNTTYSRALKLLYISNFIVKNMYAYSRVEDGLSKN